MKLIVFDVETKKAFDEVGGYFPEKLGVSISGVYFRDEAAGIEWYRGFREEEFPEMFKLFETADRIVGFNTISFDMPALSPYYVGDLMALPNFDIMVELEKKLGHRVALDAVAKETLGEQKNGHGLDAIRYFHDGDWESLTKYCLQDVKVTKELYEYGLAHQKLMFKNKWNNLIEVPVDFRFTETAKAQVQTTLF
jgi:DEAD/DEAH box helicase domain-containing protein